MTHEKVLITGGTGFIGSHLISALYDSSFSMYSLERYVTGRYVLGERRKVKTVFGDLRDAFTVKKIVQEVQPDFVVHVAAISPVAYSFEHPNEVIEANFLGTVNLAEACLRKVPHFRQFLFASTSETYGWNNGQPLTEDSPQHPNSPYSVSKLSCEKYLLYLNKAYDFPVTILRNFNTYGRKRNAHFVVERTITQMLQKDQVKLGDPTPIRDFEYLCDHVNSYVTCLNNSQAIGEVFNFCTGKGTSIEELVNLIADLTDYDGSIEWYTIPERPLEIEILVGSYEKAKKVLDWEPKYDLATGLKECVQYWKSILSPAS